LFPGSDVFQGLGEIKLFERVVHDHLEPRPGKLEHLLRREGGGVADDFRVERGVIPPIGGDGTEFAWHR
jgi:hypothetical protein